LFATGFPLQNVNEGLYARVAQEMLAHRAFILPTLDGVPYVEKPPLLYWITAAAYASFGISEVSARAGPILGAVLASAAVLRFASRHLAGGSHLLALWIMLSSPAVVVLGRTVLC